MTTPPGQLLLVGSWCLNPTQRKTCISNVCFWPRSRSPRVNHELAMSQNCKWQQMPVYFYGLGDVNFVLLNVFICVSTWNSRLHAAEETKRSEGRDESRCSTFTSCGLLLFYLRLSVDLDTPVTRCYWWTLGRWSNATLDHQSNPSSSSSLVSCPQRALLLFFLLFVLGRLWPSGLEPHW